MPTLENACTSDTFATVQIVKEPGGCIKKPRKFRVILTGRQCKRKTDCSKSKTEID